MTRPGAILLALACASVAHAEVTFEPEEPASGISFEPETAAKPAVPAPPPIETWSEPELAFGLSARLSMDTAFDAPNENVVSFLRRAKASVRTSKGSLRVNLSTRVRWVTSAEHGENSLFSRRRSAFEVLPSEAAIELTKAGIDWSFGLLDVAWGQNPLVASADVLTPLDLRDGPLAGSESRLAMPAARARGKLGPVAWDAVFVPFFTPSRLPLFGNDWGPFVPARPAVIPDLSRQMDATTFAFFDTGAQATRYPQNDLTAPQGGLRLSTRAGPLDLALTYDEVFDRQPLYRFSPAFEQFSDALQAGERGRALTALVAMQDEQEHGIAPLEAEFVRTRVFAFDAAALAGPVRVTLDAGYSPKRVFPTSDLHTVTHPSANGALGIEYEGPPVIAAGVAGFAAFDVPAEEELLYMGSGARFAFAYLLAQHRMMDDRLHLQLAALAGFSGDFLASPQVGWSFGDVHRVSAGALLVGGPRETAGWMYHRNSEAYLEYLLQM